MSSLNKKKIECPECGHEMKLVRIKHREFLKCEFCEEESTEVKLAELKIAKEETFEIPLAPLKVVKKKTKKTAEKTEE